MQNKIISILTLLLSSMVCCGKETATDIISRYTENSNYCLSQITRSETLVVYRKDQQKEETDISLLRTEFRRNNEHWDLLENTLYGLKSKDSTEAESEQNMRRFWDGKMLYDHWFFDGVPEKVIKESPIIIVNNPTLINKNFGVGYYGAPFDGVFGGDLDPISVIAKRSSEVSVHENKEIIGDYECYVIDIKGHDGKYTIWIDPERGYNILQVEIEKNINNNAYGAQLGSDGLEKITQLKYNMKNVHLEQIDGHWIPMEGDFAYETTRGGTVSTEKRHHRRISIELNPDFVKIGAFVPNIPNGTQILIMETQGIKYVWQDGKPITDVDQSFLDVLDGEINQIKSVQEPNLLATVKTEKQPIVVNECNVPEVSQAKQNNTDKAVPLTTEEKSNYALITIIGILAILVAGITIFYKLRREHTNA